MKKFSTSFKKQLHGYNNALRGESLTEPEWLQNVRKEPMNRISKIVCTPQKRSKIKRNENHPEHDKKERRG